ncbi:3-deoxy-D-manno-octulosonic-acid transferase [Abditibacterium utsteinense]|uniref:3-deoxy-D-manno-octulosonic acid transferase n=1 Tax=Abditibacterium utsteinense TaxID=1960156 RepID=A0A2S8SX66_9BACT|nr:glycosyltransferase N-terminal domain-containing protein [Abditibacterium utsteinense]PQV65384.1 3-deoxy-D-manno-octulosonic-acid transferase [Abditibacterium utsteinense]
MRFDILFVLQNAAQTLAAPILLFKKWRRFRARGDAFEWDLARWRAPQKMKETQAPHLILVAMGFAEARLAARLTARLQAERPELRITWAIRNLVAAREGHALPLNQSVVPLPFDFFCPVGSWIESVKPDTVVFIERFQFAVLARALHNRGKKVGVVAARTRDHRGGRYKVGAFYGRWLLGAFDLMCFRSPAELEKLGAIPSSLDARVTGSLKFWPQLPAIDFEQLNSLKSWLHSAQNRPLLAAGSTQPGDEAWVFEAFAPLREKYGARLLIAPRHTSRADEVEKLCQARGWKVSRRSQFQGNPQKMKGNEESNGEFDVLLLDTLGELTHAYGAALSAFVGGTISGTGHNVLEPIAHGIAVFFGPKRGTFAAEQEMCETAGVGFRVQTPAELTQGWDKILREESWRVEMAAKARQLNELGEAAWNKTVQALLETLV